MMDTLVVILFLFLTLIIGIYFGRNIHTIKDYAISKGGFSNHIMVATLFATVIGGGSTCGIATNVYRSGVIFIFAFYGAAINKLLVAYFIAPKFKRDENILSIGDLFDKNYGTTGRLTAGCCVLLVSVATLGQQVAAIGFIFEQFFQIPFTVGLFIGVGSVVIYSAFGGIRSVVATDVFQFIFILSFIPVLLFVGLDRVGWLAGIFDSFPVEKIAISYNDNDLIKALTLCVVMTFSALDPSFIHRLLMCKDARQAVYISKVTGYLSFPLFTMMGILGLVAFAIDQNISPNLALPYLVDSLLPPILRGLVIATLLAVIMSTADSNLHVVGLSVVQDLILPIYGKKLSDKRQIFFVRGATVLLGFIACLIAIYFRDIFSIMIFAFGFWGPTILVPFVFFLYGYVFTKKQLLTGIIFGQTVVIGWNLFLKEQLIFDGFIPAMLCSFSYFLIILSDERKLKNALAYSGNTKSIE